MKTDWLMLVLGMALSGPAAVLAAETAGEADSRLTLQGFGTLGIARSDNDRLQYVRDLSQPAGLDSGWSGKIDSVLGLQAGYRFNDKLDGIAQVISRYRYDGSWEPEISWAFLRYEPTPDLRLRFGRLGTEFYMMADSRLVGYANLTVRPPPDFFGPLVFSYLDGLDARLVWQVGEGLLHGKVFAGISPESTPFVDGFHWDLAGSLLLGGHLDYQNGPWQVRLSHASIHFENEAPLAAAFGEPNLLAYFPALAIADTWSRYNALGVVYDRGPFQLQLMLNRIDHESSSYEDSQAGYAIASYQTGKLRPFLGYSWVKSKPTPPGKDLLGISAGTHSDQHSWILGTRWDFRKDFDLKAQVEWIAGSPSSVFPARYDPAGAPPYWDGRMTVFSIALDFVF